MPDNFSTFIIPHLFPCLTRTAADWAEEMKYLLTSCYPDSEKIILVMDNLNTHAVSSLYKKYPAQEARSYAKGLEIHYTPKQSKVQA